MAMLPLVSVRSSPWREASNTRPHRYLCNPLESVLPVKKSIVCSGMFHRARNLPVALILLLFQECGGFPIVPPRRLIRRNTATTPRRSVVKAEPTHRSWSRLRLCRPPGVLLASEATMQNDHEVLDSFLCKLEDSLHSNRFQSFTIFGPDKNNKKRTIAKNPQSRSTPSEERNPPPGSLKLITGRLIQLKAGVPKKRARTANSGRSTTTAATTTTVMHITFKYHGATDICKNWAVFDSADQLRQLFVHRHPEALAEIASEWGSESLFIPPATASTAVTGLKGILETNQCTWELATTQNHYQLKYRERASSSRTLTSPTNQSLSHDKPKQGPVPTTVDFWQALGVTNEFGQPKPGMASKVRQCQKFVEIVAQLLPRDLVNATNAEDGNRRIQITDMGCGRGYLTFALHTYLQQRLPPELVQTIGVDVRPKLVAELNGIVKTLHTSNLSFEEGTIQSYLFKDDHNANSDTTFQIFVALHACDTATDDALYTAIQRRANVIVTAPCCHKELRPQINSLAAKQVDHPLLEVIRHGIYRERTSETVTDSLRALLLELAGYKTRVFEFVGGEHTAKNCMITGVLNDSWGPSDASSNGQRQRIHALAAFFGIRQQKLAELMGEQALLQSTLPAVLTNRNMPPL